MTSKWNAYCTTCALKLHSTGRRERNPLCESCTYLNRADRTRCEICDSNRPNKGFSLPSTDPTSILVDWTCEACTFYNPLRTDTLIYQLLTSTSNGKLLEAKRFLHQHPSLLNQCYSSTPRYTPFMIACKNGHMECVLYFLELGVDVCQQNAEGYTGLLLAGFHGHTQIVSLLIRETEGDQVYIQTKDGFSIGHMPKVYDAVNRGFSRLREKMAKIKRIMFDLMGDVSNNVLNVILEYCILAHLNASGVGEDRRFLDEDF